MLRQVLIGFSRVMAHPRVIEWQKRWVSNAPTKQHTIRDTEDEMDAEEAISGFWN
jgi:hypothetical protein